MCNNTSGAANYLIASSIYKNVEKELDRVYGACNTGGYTSKNLELELEAIVNEVLEYVISKNGEYETNSDDMYSYGEPDARDDDEDEEDEYDNSDEDEDY
jgi:hypothetical protein